MDTLKLERLKREYNAQVNSMCQFYQMDEERIKNAPLDNTIDESMKRYALEGLRAERARRLNALRRNYFQQLGEVVNNTL